MQETEKVRNLLLNTINLFMKLLILILSLVTVSAQTNLVKANTLMKLTWDLNPDEEFVDYYKVVISGTNGFSSTITGAANFYELSAIMKNVPNGVYNFSVSAIGQSGLESEPSTNLWVFWYGNKPNAPKNIVVKFKNQ